jgi:hypothetical protein
MQPIEIISAGFLINRAIMDNVPSDAQDPMCDRYCRFFPA